LWSNIGPTAISDMNNIYFKLVLPTVFSILLFILTIFFVIIPRYKQNIMNGKREMIKELTNSALSILSKYENDERDGILTRPEAQTTAVSRIQYLRYGEENKDYFWITDMTPKMIMHPFRNDLNGKDLTNFTDPHGKRLFVEFVETVKKSDHGYVDYMWQWKDDSLHIVPKLSYVEIFKPWDWVIGTGVYIEDVEKEISSLTRRMIWLSTAISILIAFLLFYIIKQSFGLEQKRIQAENELHTSKEKFRTLVEAATEGLIMLIDGKISYSNNVISKMTGYSSVELLNLSLTEIINRNYNTDIIYNFSGNTIRDGKYELFLNRKNGGFIEVLITSSTTVFYGKAVNIIIVKDISTGENINLSSKDYQKLISILDVGFFKARIDTNGKFIFANEKTIRILGFESFEELSNTNIFRLVADSVERKNLRKTIAEKGSLKNKVLKIIKKNGDYSIIALSLVLNNEENSDDLICDGVIEDITLQENDKIQTANLIAELKTNDFMLEQSVKDLVTEVRTMDADSTLSDAIHLLTVHKTDSLLLTKNGNDYLGIITSTDIQKRILSLNLNLDNPAYLIMSSPVKYITESATVIDAIKICDDNNINHLIVKNEADGITGMLKSHDIHKMLLNSLSFFTGNVRKAETDHEIKQYYNNLRKLIIPLIKSEVSVKYITNITTAFSDAVTERLIELAQRELGNPPAGFVFICLGSEGRKEETLFTDQDNAIIYEDVSKGKEVAVNEYFLRLGERVCNSLDYVGYSYCKGNIMAKNHQWCKPLSDWEKYFTGWVGTPEPQNLLDASVFFDLRTVFGDRIITEKLRETVSGSIKDNPLFLYHLACNTFNTKPQHISSGNLLSDRNADMVDLKSAVVPIIMFARTYSLQNNIVCTNTIERLIALKEKNILTENTVDEIVYAYNFLMKLRFRNQADLLNRNILLSNSMNTKKMIDPELYLLKRILISIPDYQDKIKTDFRITN
jgi:PAS domain S-box-containing protein